MVILCCNSGSSSLKFSIYDMNKNSSHEELAGAVENIGSRSGAFVLKKPERISRAKVFDSHTQAAQAIVDFIKTNKAVRPIEAIGHRIVHGGLKFIDPQVIDNPMLEMIEQLIPFAPDHLPHELAIIRMLADTLPGIPQVACFDTAFHRTMPLRAQRYAIPTQLHNEGILRYGFHGLSYEYIMTQLREHQGPLVDGRIIIAHLGNGCSMTAVSQGISIETTMGFTPAGGLVMSTRSGDLDPGVLIYLQKYKQMSPSEINDLVNKHSGLAALAESDPGMKELLVRSASDERASMAIEIFCYQACKFVGALAAALEGLDLLVFTGGIGERSPAIRENICRGLAYLGIKIDKQCNEKSEPCISANGSRVSVQVIPTNEDLMIARHTFHILED
jgi:acetate kinase